MSKLSCLVPVAALLLAACVVSGDDDDGADTSGNNSTTANTSNSTTASTTTTIGTSDSTGLETGSSDASASSVGDGTTATESTGNAGTCGWGMTGETTTPMGYVCGVEGEDPGGMIDIACPAAVDLVEQGECGGNMGITGAGCCDAEGNVWFCADDDAEPRLFTQDC
ncbi:MAG: hypothetical protein IAG13_03825 [Deltaproteobacteria bacterium]|nr:hypothetical protein [Nannocystaceae bacterium]